MAQLDEIKPRLRDLEQLEVIASRSSSQHQYHRVSDFLASTVMREGEAVESAALVRHPEPRRTIQRPTVC